MSKMTLTVMYIFLVLAATAFAQDTTPPVTAKTYGDPNAPGLFDVPSCAGTVSVNVHFITSGTTITLAATDEEGGSGVNSVWYTVLVPAQCEQGDEVEYVGLGDFNIYENLEQCQLATDNPETEELETQECAATWWNFDEVFLGPLDETSEGFIQYQEPFVIPQESVHKICYFSEDNAGNQEFPHCQVAVVDDNPPTVSARVDHLIIDLEYFEGQIGYFNDPKCAFFEISASDTHGIDTVQVNVQGALLSMFYPQVTGLPTFSEQAWESYLAQEMHSMPSASFDSQAGLYKYQFCAGEHVYHLYDMGIISWDDLRTLVSGELVLGELEFPVLATDKAGRESQTTANLTIVDLTVPLEQGWNLRSTPIRLEGNKFWPLASVDAVLRWDSQLQSWQLVTDNSISPLDALYMHATERNQIGYIFERDLTSPPVRQLHEGWNLVGPANLLYDSLQGGSYLTYLWDQSTYIGQAFGALVHDSDGNRALEAVISPQQYLSYSDNWGSWNFNQDPFVWIPQVTQQNTDPSNYWDQTVRNFAGYWIFMQNPDMLPGFTTTPLPLNSDS
jgi:hypothetical protein